MCYSSDRRRGPKNNTTDCHNDMILMYDLQEEKPRHRQASKYGEHRAERRSGSEESEVNTPAPCTRLSLMQITPYKWMHIMKE